jgi:hypothetical protein
LSSTNNRLSGHIALGNDHLLGQEYLASGDFDTKVTSSHHHTVRFPENFIEIFETLLVFNLDDNLDVGTIGTEALPDVDHILGTTDEGGKDHVDTVLDTKLQVLLVLFGQGRQVDWSLGKVDSLSGADVTIVESTDADVGTFDSQDEEGQDTVVDVDKLSGFGNLGQVCLEDNELLERRLR